tara:strand:- start:2468 stop:3298 length:831 start_codon:yes stop_codon:yes gene_type:complete
MRIFHLLTLGLALFSAPAFGAQFTCDDPDVEVELNLPVVSPGQTVEVTLRNNSSQLIQLPSSCLFGAVYNGFNCTGAVVYGIGCLAVITPIQPGQEWSQSWDQTDLAGSQVLPGTYSIRIQWWDDGFTQLHSCCVPLTITTCQGPGTPTCAPLPNSLGVSSTLCAQGSATVADADLSLVAGNIPIGEFGFFLVSATTGQSFPAQSDGVLCLSGNIGRMNDLSQLFQGPFGSVPIDFMALPQSPSQPILPGDTWIFQGWHRDGASSNFTNALTVTFL